MALINRNGRGLLGLGASRDPSEVITRELRRATYDTIVRVRLFPQLPHDQLVTGLSYLITPYSQASKPVIVVFTDLLWQDMWLPPYQHAQAFWREVEDRMKAAGLPGNFAPIPSEAKALGWYYADAVYDPFEWRDELVNHFQDQPSKFNYDAYTRYNRIRPPHNNGGGNGTLHGFGDWQDTVEAYSRRGAAAAGRGLVRSAKWAAPRLKKSGLIAVQHGAQLLSRGASALAQKAAAARLQGCSCPGGLGSAMRRCSCDARKWRG